MSPKAVLFDMDGVIVNSEDFWVELETEEILPAAVEGQEVSEDEITGINYREIYDYLDERYEVSVGREEWLEYYESAAGDIYAEKVDLMPGFRDLLAALHDRGLRVAVVSSSPHEWIGMVTERFGIDGEFDAVISADDVDADSKPEPDVYEHAAREVGVDPADCIAVEDSKNGVKSAKAAGMTAIGYRTETNAEMDLSEADAVADGAEELREELLSRTE
ncbi:MULTISPECIES: HAD family phosphatase [Halostella]|uniref:HAD family hydrolase n=1 Tax=Halostella TaxID=1843185 RepID=UPI0021752F4B|nr:MULTISPECIES: HAD family phosphatase [Halostella]